MKGIEPPTPSLPWKCSTPELHWQRPSHQEFNPKEKLTED